MTKETYLGDGVHASFNGTYVTLRSPQLGGGNDTIVLSSAALVAFASYVAGLMDDYGVPDEPDK